MNGTCPRPRALFPRTTPCCVCLQHESEPRSMTTSLWPACVKCFRAECRGSTRSSDGRSNRKGEDEGSGAHERFPMVTGANGRGRARWGRKYWASSGLVVVAIYTDIWATANPFNGSARPFVVLVKTMHYTVHTGRPLHWQRTSFDRGRRETKGTQNAVALRWEETVTAEGLGWPPAD
jgi:hypothetical protein